MVTKLGKVKGMAMLNALVDTQAAMKPNSFGETVGDVKVEALFNTIATHCTIRRLRDWGSRWQNGNKR